jgi:hypothetical protein
MDPCLEAFGVAERGKVPPRRDESLLDGVLGAPDVTQDPMRDGEETVSQAAGDRGERLLVPGASRLDECEVHPQAPSFAPLGRGVSPSMSGARRESG